MFFHRQERTALHLLTRTVRHRSLHGPITMNVSVSGPVAVFVPVHIESCTIYFCFLNFYRYRIRICTRNDWNRPLMDPFTSHLQLNRSIYPPACLCVYLLVCFCVLLVEFRTRGRKVASSSPRRSSGRTVLSRVNFQC